MTDPIPAAGSKHPHAGRRKTDARSAGRRPVIGVMGAGESATADDVERAERLGELVAREGWVLLTGGRPIGVMAAATRGASRVAGSLVIGVLPDEGGAVAPGVDVAIFTGLGGARNNVNVLSSDVVVACGRGGAGTASEVALALKARRPVVLLVPTPEAAAFYRMLAGSEVRTVATPEEAIGTIRELLRREGR